MRQVERRATQPASTPDVDYDWAWLRGVRVVLAAIAIALTLSGCQKIETLLFTRNSPQVDRAIHAIETQDAGDAHRLLADYLSTGRCQDGSLGTPDSVREYERASLDLGLALFQIAERYGQKFGELPPATPEGQGAADPELVKRSQHVDCAQRVVRVIAQDKDLPVLLRARAFYLSGNLDFLRHDYESAVSSYDSALLLVPGGSSDAGLGIGTKAAWNRAIALRRIEDEKKDEPPKPDAGAPESQDGGAPEQDPDDSKNQDEDSDEKENEDSSEESSDGDEQKQDEKESQKQEQEEKDSQSQADSQEPQKQPDDTQAAKRPSLSQDERVLQMLERAPMLQQELPKTQGRIRGRSSMEDK